MERIILVFIKEGDVVFDLFNGSGIIGVVVFMLDRKYIGIDFEKDYLDLMIRWLENIGEVDKWKDYLIVL